MRDCVGCVFREIAMMRKPPRHSQSGRSWNSGPDRSCSAFSRARTLTNCAAGRAPLREASFKPIYKQKGRHLEAAFAPLRSPPKAARARDAAISAFNSNSTKVSRSR